MAWLRTGRHQSNIAAFRAGGHRRLTPRSHSWLRHQRSPTALLQLSRANRTEATRRCGPRQFSSERNKIQQPTGTTMAHSFVFTRCETLGEKLESDSWLLANRGAE